MDIKQLEAAAKFDLPEAEREWMAARLDILTESFKALEGVDTEGATPLVTVLNLQNVLRDDVAVKLLSRDKILENAPEQYDGYFQVPRTLE